ncbi:tail terminator [Erwinia phage AH03]|uniref:Tail terminator n=1 Tax=Erwinia phage AH03 TaxID=2869568 RepID=A0AAE8BQ72_9CAUD|nr:tail terminator [Erwinia phage AH03]
MTTDYIESGDLIYSRILQVWNDESPAIFGYVPKLYWPNKAIPDKVDGSKSWGRVTRRAVSEEQSGFVSCVYNSQVRYENNGIIFIQLFGSISENSDVKIQKLSEALKNNFKRRCTDNKVIFRNSRINPLDPEDLFYRYNVVFEYQYDVLV